MKTIIFKAIPFQKELVTLALESGVDAILAEADTAEADRLIAELVTVRRAQAKLAGGSAGRCDECGVEIPPERLEVLPWAVRCVNCAD